MTYTIICISITEEIWNTSDLMFPKWCGRGSMARRMLMEALLKSVGFTYILNLDSSLRKAEKSQTKPREEPAADPEAEERSSPVWNNSFQSGYEIGNHHIDALQISAEQRRRVEDDGSQNWSTDKIWYLETLNKDHVEPAGRNETWCHSRLQQERDTWKSATWTGRRTEYLLQFSCYRRCDRACRRPPLVRPRSSLGTHWYQTKGLAPWSRSTSENLSFSGPNPAEWLSLQEAGGHREWENPEWHCGHLFACIYAGQIDYNVHSKRWIDHIWYIKATKYLASITKIHPIYTFESILYRKLWHKEFAKQVSFGSLAYVEKGQTCRSDSKVPVSASSENSRDDICISQSTDHSLHALRHQTNKTTTQMNRQHKLK